MSIQAFFPAALGKWHWSGNWRVGGRSWDFICGSEPWCIPPVPAASTGTEPPFTGFFRLFSLPRVLYFMLTASHWQSKYRRNRVTSCLKQQSSTSAESLGWTRWEAGFGIPGSSPHLALLRCQDTLQTLMPFQGISKTLECIKIWASSQPDHCSHKHEPGAPLSIHSQNWTTLGCDQHSVSILLTLAPSDGLFSRTLFPLVLSSGVGMGRTPSAGLWYLMETQFEPPFFNDSL